MLPDGGAIPSAKPPQIRAAGDDGVNDREVLLAEFAYVPVLCLVPIIVRQPGDFIAFHLRQGLTLMILELVAGMTSFIPHVGPYAATTLAAPCLVASMIAFVRTRRRETWEIPLVIRLANSLSL